MSPRSVLLLIAGLVLAPGVAAMGLSQPQSYLVGYEPEKKSEVVRSLTEAGLHVDRDIAALQTLRATSPSILSVERLLGMAGVVFAEKDATAKAAGAQWNGAQWDGAQWDGAQWNGEMGEGGGAWGHAVVRTAEAWSIEGGSGSAEICVVDSGVDAAHPDLANNAWTEGGVHGFNAIDGSSDASDDAGHGTHVAGIAAAVRGNGVGVAGVTKSPIMSAKVLGEDGTGTVADLATGMVWCADHGAEVVLLALSLDAESQTAKRALDYLERHDVVVVASAGNGGCSNCVSYPARHPPVLAVSAIGPDGRIAAFSSTGPQVDIAAPGVGITSTFDGDGYATGSGTSQAAAWVAGAAALLREHRPELKAAQVRDALREGAADGGAPGKDDLYGAGVLDVHGALRASGGRG